MYPHAQGFAPQQGILPIVPMGLYTTISLILQHGIHMILLCVLNKKIL